LGAEESVWSKGPQALTVEDVKTTMIYTHTVPPHTKKERKSLLDF
jgi:hypothetical protein